MSWESIAALITGIGTIIAIVVSIYSVIKNQRVNEVNILKDNNNKFIDDLYNFLGCFDSEYAFSMLYRIENVIGDIIFKRENANINFNNFKIYISDLLRNAKLYQAKVVSDFNSYVDKKNEKSIDKCGEIISKFYLTNHNFYRKTEDYIDELLKIAKLRGDFDVLKVKAVELVDCLCEVYFVNSLFIEFVANFSMQLKTSVQNSKAYSIKQKQSLVFEKTYNYMCDLGYMGNDNTKSSKQLETVQKYLISIRRTRLEVLSNSLNYYNFIIREGLDK